MSFSFLDGFSVDSRGSSILENKIFTEQAFESLVINPTTVNPVVLKNIVFDRCSVEFSSCRFLKGTSLKNVVFKEFNCGDALNISSEVTLDNVVIEGNKFPKVLWIKPQGKPAQLNPLNEDVDVCLDISRFEGEVMITGLPTNKVVIDPSKQIIIRADLLEKADWKGLGISGLSDWKILAKKTLISGVSEGIYSIPSQKERHYAESMAELEILRQAKLID